MNQQALHILQTLAEIPSVSGNYEANHQALAFVNSFLRERGMHITRHEFNGVESLVATTQRTKSPTVMFCGHVDVVPANAEQYKLTRKDSKLYGRGMVDMKAAVAAFLQVVDELRDQLHEYDFGLMIVSDEEVGGFNGVKPLLEQEGYRPKMCIIPDGGRDWALETFAKGLWLFEVAAVGKSAHGSRPWEGDSAVRRLLSLAHEVQALFPATQGWDTSTCTVSQFRGGEAINQVPSQATASFDLRFASVADEKRIMDAVKTLLQKHQTHITSEVYSAPCINDPENPYLASFLQTLNTVVGRDVGTTISNAASDARFFAAKNIPCAVFFPAGAGHHGPEEWIKEEAYAQLQQIFLDYLNKEATIASDESAIELEKVTV